MEFPKIHYVLKKVFPEHFKFVSKSSDKIDYNYIANIAFIRVFAQPEKFPSLTDEDKNILKDFVSSIIKPLSHSDNCNLELALN